MKHALNRFIERDTIIWSWIVALSLLLLAAGGCSTSPEFQLAAFKTCPLVAADVPTFTTDAKARSDASKLATDTAIQSAIDFSAVDADWANVAPVWHAGIGSSTLPEDSKAIRTESVNAFEVVLAKERNRRLGIFGTPTTQP